MEIIAKKNGKLRMALRLELSHRTWDAGELGKRMVETKWSLTPLVTIIEGGYWISTRTPSTRIPATSTVHLSCRRSNQLQESHSIFFAFLVLFPSRLHFTIAIPAWCLWGVFTSPSSFLETWPKMVAPSLSWGMESIHIPHSAHVHIKVTALHGSTRVH